MTTYGDLEDIWGAARLAAPQRAAAPPRGVYRSSTIRKAHETVRQIEDLRPRGQSERRTAELLGISRDTLRRYRKIVDTLGLTD